MMIGAPISIVVAIVNENSDDDSSANIALMINAKRDSNVFKECLPLTSSTACECFYSFRPCVPRSHSVHPLESRAGERAFKQATAVTRFLPRNLLQTHFYFMASSDDIETNESSKRKRGKISEVFFGPFAEEEEEEKRGAEPS